MKSEATTLAPPPAGTAATQYGFGGRLTQDFPSQVIVDITEVCNLACIHCPHPEFKKSEHYGARYLEPELNQKLIDEVKAYGPGGARSSCCARGGCARCRPPGRPPSAGGGSRRSPRPRPPRMT